MGCVRFGYWVLGIGYWVLGNYRILMNKSNQQINFRLPTSSPLSYNIAMRRNGLITALVVLLGVVAVVRVVGSLGFPLFSNAQQNTSSSNTAIGTHAGFFDYGNNIKIAELVKNKGGTTITVMIGINDTADQINSVLNASDGLTKIVRIVGVDHNASLNSGTASAIAEKLNNSAIKPGTLVVFGNEVNNLDKEWKLCSTACPDQTTTAAREYGGFFTTFKNAAATAKYTPVPAPLDMYNSVYPDFSTFITESGVYGGTVVANVYELGTSGLDSYKNYPNNGANVAAFTEYGPDPAKSLQQHLTFYKSHTPPDGKIATTLVPNKCDSASDSWLYYINGKIYDAQGNEIDPATCDKSTGHTGLPPAGDYYKRFIYPFYSVSSSADDITNKLLSDYSMTCSNPADYQTRNGGSGTIERLIFYQRESCRNAIDSTACLFEPSATFGVSSTGVNRIFGVLRNENEVKWRAYDYSLTNDQKKREFTNRFESVEQWFGANNPSLHTPGGQGEYLNQTPDEINGLHQGPFYKLSSLYSLCLAEQEVLKASVDICKEADPSGDCALTTRKIYGTEKTYGQLAGEVSAHPDICKNVFQPQEEGQAPSEQEQRLANEMSRVDLYQETAYRPAFLVLVTEIDKDATKHAISPDNPSQQIRPGVAINEQSDHVVDFLVYHVPDTITDFKEGEPGAVDDVITRTVNVFTPQQVQLDVKKVWDQNRTNLQAASDDPSPIPVIRCFDPECNRPLEKGLINFINAYAQAQLTDACTHPITEDAESGSRIGSQLAPNDTDPDQAAAMKGGKPISSAENKIKIQEYRDKGNSVVGNRTPQPQTVIYNVTPHGFRTKYVAEAFDALFAQAQQSGQFQDDGDYLTTFESIFGSSLASDPDIVGYNEPTEVTVDGETHVVYQPKEVRDEIYLSQEPPQVSARIPWLAKIFNHSTRAVVQQVSSAGQNLLECARAVTDPKKNTEDFLLHCQSRGQAIGDNSIPSNTDLGAPATGFEEFRIQYWNDSYLNFTIPPQLVVDAANAAGAKHGCDPYLVIATAHSESQSYTNHQNPNYASARGVWQFTALNWVYDAWKIAFYTKPPATSNFVSQDGDHFDCRNPASETTCSPTNVYAAADAACRLLNAIGANGQYDNEDNFVKAFAVRNNSFNEYGRVWNECPTQGEYVWRLWHALKEKDYTSYTDQRVHYGSCF